MAIFNSYVKRPEGISKGSFIGEHRLLARNIQWISVDCTIPMSCMKIKNLKKKWQVEMENGDSPDGTGCHGIKGGLFKKLFLPVQKS